MKKLAAAAPLVAILMLWPFFAAVFIQAIAGPAAGQELQAVACTGAMPASGAWRPPFQQAYVSTSGFGSRFHPVYREQRQHTGVDLVSQPGPGPVVAASSGRVLRAGVQGAYGNAVVLEHTGGVSTLYAHLASIDPAVTVGAAVWGGQQLGVEGSTGASTGNHLHFEVRNGGTPTDPVSFMAQRGAPLDGNAVAPSAPPGTDPTGGASVVEGGIGFPLPPAEEPRRASVGTAPLPIPAAMQALYVAAADTYKIPWTLLAGIGMEETGHGRNTSTSSAGAQGPMQFMPATWASMGVDGDGDGRAEITNPADSVFSAANYLTRSGVGSGPDGVRRALWAYNHADWYVNDVLHYAHAYGGGAVLGDPTQCPEGQGNPDLPPLTTERVTTLLTWARTHAGAPYVFGANGPDAWDCSSFTRAAYAEVGISMPRTAGAQRDWLAAGNGYQVPSGQERPGDLIFWDSYLGPNRVGHVAIVWDPATTTTIDARSTDKGVGHFAYTPTEHTIFEIWRVGNMTDDPSAVTAASPG